jgi:hypothetical protein
MFTRQSLTIVLSTLIAFSTLTACATPPLTPQVVVVEVTRLVPITSTPGSSEPPATPNPVPSSGEEGIVESDRSGQFQIKDSNGTLITVALLDSKGDGVAGARILSASYPAGTLLYITPPIESVLVPKFHFVNRAQGRIGGLLSSPRQGMPSITIHLSDIDTAPLIQETPVPGPLEDFWKSVGWKHTVDNTRRICEFFSTLGDIEDMKNIVVVSYDVTKGIIQSVSLKKLGMIAGKGISFVSETMVGEGFFQLCLAATGDEVGLSGLTGVVHEKDHVQFLVVEGPLTGIVSGRVLDDQTRSAMRDVIVASGQNSTQTTSYGRFYISAKTADKFDLTLKHDGYSPSTMSVSPAASDYLDLGDLIMSAVPASTPTPVPVRVIPEGFYMVRKGNQQQFKDGKLDKQCDYTATLRQAEMIDSRTMEIATEIVFACSDSYWQSRNRKGMVQIDIYTGDSTDEATGYDNYKDYWTGETRTITIMGQRISARVRQYSYTGSKSEGFSPWECSDTKLFLPSIELSLSLEHTCTTTSSKGIGYKTIEQWEVVDTNLPLDK